jgi:hypothetical protein
MASWQLALRTRRICPLRERLSLRRAVIVPAAAAARIARGSQLIRHSRATILDKKRSFDRPFLRTLGLAAGTMLWINHAPCLRALGGTTAEFYREVWREESRFLKRLEVEATIPRI